MVVSPTTTGGGSKSRLHECCRTALLATIHLTIVELRHRAGLAFQEVASGVILPSGIAIVGSVSRGGPDCIMGLAEVGIRLGCVSVAPGVALPSGVASPPIVAR